MRFRVFSRILKYFMADVVQQIKDRLNIIDVISPYVELHKAGKYLKARCPFHNEKTPSFHVSPEKGMYHCYGCGVGGDMFTFIEAIEGVDFKAALKILADKARVELVPVSPEKQSERERLFAVMEAAAQFYVAELHKNPDVQAYIKKRGVLTDTIASWRIGYAPGPPQGGWRATKAHLRAQGFTEKELVAAGLVKEAGEGKESYDVFRQRVMFPLFDQSGRVVAFSGRTLESGTDIPKYVNSPETELFKKSEILYGYDRAKHGIRQLDFSLIVEGQFDVVMSHQAGYSNTVAVSGTAFTLEHAHLLERLSPRVVLALDADKAGIAAAKKVADIMLRRGLDVKVAILPDGKDPADIVKDDPKEFKRCIGSSVHVIEFLMQRLLTAQLDSRTLKLRAREEVIPYIPLLPNRIDQDHFETVVAELLKTTKDAVHYEVERIEERDQSAMRVEPVRDGGELVREDVGSRFKALLTYLLGVMPLFEESVQGRVRRVISEICEAPYAVLETQVPVAKRAEVLFKAESQHASQPKLQFETDVIHALNQLRVTQIRQAIKDAKEQLAEAELSGDQTEILRCLTIIQEKQKRLQDEPFSLTLLREG